MAGIRPGSATQNVLTSGVVLGLLLVVGAGLPVASPATPLGVALATPANGTSAFGLCMVFVLLTYGGWNEAAYVSAEVESPDRTMVRALVGSILIVTGLYLLVNWAYLRGLGHAGVAASTAVAADLAERVAGGVGAQLVSALIVLAAIPRRMPRSSLAPGPPTPWAATSRPSRCSGRWNPATRTPVNALLIQGGIALALTAVGGWTRNGFETMVEYTAPVFWLFLLLTGASLFVLRRRGPAVRAFRVPLYPVTPLVFCATSGYLLYASLAYTGVGALLGVAVVGIGGLVLAGLPADREAQGSVAE